MLEALLLSAKLDASIPAFPTLPEPLLRQTAEFCISLGAFGETVATNRDRGRPAHVVVTDAQHILPGYMTPFIIEIIGHIYRDPLDPFITRLVLMQHCLTAILPE